jgi:hypothetical protein
MDSSPSADRIIVASLIGGLGNQMFQYAHALEVSVKCAARLELVWHGGDFPSSREYGLNRFGLSLAETLPPLAEWRFIDYYGPYRPGMENDIPKQVMRSEGSICCLRGYFQNEFFFRNVADKVRDRFGSIVGTVSAPANTTPVAVHVRRTDFLTRPVHNICDLDYFLSAMKLMTTLVDRPHFIVFSDDYDWCRSVFAPSPNLEFRPLSSDGDDFAAMLACKAFIIPNSTFSWWPAWLTRASTVICPTHFLKGRSWPINLESWISLPPHVSAGI